MSQEDFELAVREDAGILLKEDTRNLSLIHIYYGFVRLLDQKNRTKP